MSLPVPSPPSIASRKFWFYTDAENQPIGPLLASELLELAESGVIKSETHVIEEGGTAWRTFGSLTTPTPPPLPAPLQYLEPNTARREPLHTVRGAQDLLEIFNDKLTITPKGVLGFLNKGLKGAKDIPFASIFAIQLRKAGLMRGYIQFTVPGGNESKGGLLSAIKDENTFLFDKKHNELMAQIKVFIERRTGELRTAQPSHTSPPKLHLSEELQKLANLHTQGVLSSEEFQVAKNRLLGQ